MIKMSCTPITVGLLNSQILARGVCKTLSSNAVIVSWEEVLEKVWILKLLISSCPGVWSGIVGVVGLEGLLGKLGSSKFNQI